MKKVKNSVSKAEETTLKNRGYTVERLLGEGSYSKVKSARWKRPDSNDSYTVALKIINRSTAPQEFLDKFWPREKNIMEIVDHKNIVKMYEVFYEGNKIYMSLERAPRGDLLDYVRLKGPLKDNEAKMYFNDICNGVNYIHNLGIVHRDLKCENLLLFERSTLKIADFGFARKIGSSDLSKTFCGSAAYAAPELLKGEPYPGPIADCWSIGVILFIMICSRMPYSDCSINELVDQQSKPVKFPHKKNLNIEYIDLVNNILCFDLKKRFRLHQIMNHHWNVITVAKVPPSREKQQQQQHTFDSGCGSARNSITTILEPPVVNTIHNKIHKPFQT